MRTTGGRQMQIELGLARVTHGDPSEILAEPNVTSSFEAQDVAVEGKRIEPAFGARHTIRRRGDARSSSVFG